MGKDAFIEENKVMYIRIDQLREEAAKCLERFERWKEVPLIYKAIRCLEDAVDILMILIDQGRKKGFDMRIEEDEMVFLRQKIDELREAISPRS